MTLAEDRQAEQTHKFKPYLMHAVLISDVTDCSGSGAAASPGSQSTNISGHPAKPGSPFWKRVAAQSGHQ